MLRSQKRLQHLLYNVNQVKLRRRTPQQSWRGMQGAAAKLFKFEQIQLFIAFFFFLGTLLLNVISNDFSSYAIPHCTDIATITPKLATPEFFLDLWKSLTANRNQYQI